MISLFKGLFRTSIITTVLVAVAVGGAVIFAGEGRTRAVLENVHSKVMHTIDSAIDDPTAARAQLRNLEQEYPERIRMVRGDLAELKEQLGQLQRERAVAERVVTLTDKDLSELEPQVAAAAAARMGGGTQVVVMLQNHVYSADAAANKMNQIRQTRVAYANRAADAAHDMTYLQSQANRLGELLNQLENERAQFQTQIWQLSRQVDSIARNERLIKLLEKRNRTIDNCSRYDASSLDQLTGRLAEVRSRQEAELDLLANRQQQSDYEQMARFEVQVQVEGSAAIRTQAGDSAPASGTRHVAIR
ncbi:MAG: chromosome segregation ATPase [Chlamydiales bacterium]|jgi:chromosome segregation ATPase